MTDSAEIREEIEKAVSLVAAARRLLATGTMVDLSALEGKVRAICEGAVEIGGAEGGEFVPGMEALIGDLDRLAESIRERAEQPSGGPSP